MASKSSDPIAQARIELEALLQIAAKADIEDPEAMAVCHEREADWRRRWIADGPQSSPLALWAWLQFQPSDTREFVATAHDVDLADVPQPAIAERLRRQAVAYAKRQAEADPRLDPPDAAADLQAIERWALKAARLMANAPDPRSAPMSKAELARRILHNAKARARDVEWGRFDLRKEGGKRWTVSLAGMDHAMLDRVTAEK